MAGHSCMDFASSDPDVQRFGLGAAALRYQGWGYAVLPLVRGGKKPHRMLPWAPDQPSGVHHAELDRNMTRAWWLQDPAANVGVATGSKSRLVVIDLDVKRGVNGTVSFTGFLNDHGLAVPLDMPWVQTPSGGWHAWLRTPAGVVVPERPSILPGVDVKGDGGLVVAPPSMILVQSGWRPGEPRDGSEAPVPYAWAAGCPCSVPDAPAWVMPWLLSAPSSGSPGQPAGGENAETPGLDSLKATGIPRGERNAVMYRLACRLFRERGTSIEASLSVKEDLMQVWQACPDRTGFSPGELLTLIDSARRFVAGEVNREMTMVKGAAEWLTRGNTQQNQ